MNFKILPNGNLAIIMNRGDKSTIREMVQKNPHDGIFMAELLEFTGWTPNGRLHQVNAQDIGALTEAPIITDEMTIEDNGSVTVQGNVWWYPGYEAKHFGDVLLETGRVVFSAAPEVPESAYAAQACA